MPKRGDIMWLEDDREGHVPFLIITKVEDENGCIYQGYYLSTLPEEREESKTVGEILGYKKDLSVIHLNLRDLVKKNLVPKTLLLLFIHSFTVDEFERKLTLKERNQLLISHYYV